MPDLSPALSVASAPAQPAEQLEKVARIMRTAADRLNSAGGDDPEALRLIGDRLRAFADSLNEENAADVLDALTEISQVNPSTLVASSVMAGLSIQNRDTAPSDTGGSMPTRKPAVERLAHAILSIDSANQAGEAAEAHSVPMTLAAVSVAWLMAGIASESEVPDASAPARAPDASHGMPVAPGGLGYMMTLSDKEEKEIAWGTAEAPATGT